MFKGLLQLIGVVWSNDIDISHKPYRPRLCWDIWDHVGHKKCPYRPQTTSARHIHICHRSKQAMPYVLVTFLFALQLKFTSQFTFCEFLCVFFTLLTTNWITGNCYRLSNIRDQLHCYRPTFAHRFQFSKFDNFKVIVCASQLQRKQNHHLVFFITINQSINQSINHSINQLFLEGTAYKYALHVYNHNPRGNSRVWSHALSCTHLYQRHHCYIIHLQRYHHHPNSSFWSQLSSWHSASSAAVCMACSLQVHWVCVCVCIVIDLLIEGSIEYTYWFSWTARPIQCFVNQLHQVATSGVVFAMNQSINLFFIRHNCRTRQ